LAVDVGCGSGLLAGELAPLCESVVGLDISWGMLLLARRHLREKGAGNGCLVMAEADHPPLRDGHVDFVFSVNALHHTDLEVSLPALQRLVAPGGRLAIRIVTTRNSRAWQWLPVRVAYSFKSAPGYFLKHGFAAGLRIAAFLLHPRWLTGSRRPKLTGEEFAAVAQRLLPDSSVEPAWRNGMTVFWERPSHT